MKKISIVGLALLVLLVAACSPRRSSNSAQDNAVTQQNGNTARLIANQPAPTLANSADRAALIKRYERTADPNFRQYIAIVTPQGGVLYTGVVKGKVTPLDSQLTPADGIDCVHHGASSRLPDGCGVVQIAEPNGTWGTNGNGVFWFDDKDVMHESSMPYILSDQPFQVTTPPILTVVGQTSVGHP